MNKKLLDRLAALEARKRARAADKAPEPFNMGYLWLFMIGRSKACRYRDGTKGLWAAAYGNTRAFSRKHGKQTGEPGEVRAAVLEQFATEELCWQLLDRIDSNGGMLADHKIVDSGVPLPLSDFRPMRPRIEPVQ